MTDKEKARVNTLIRDLEPRCFGRYLIDLPADLQPDKMAGATFAIHPYSEYSGALHVTVEPMPHSVFTSKLTSRKSNLEALHIDGEQEHAYLDGVISLDDHSGVIFNRSENGGSRGARTLELHGWKGGYAIKMTVNANDVNYPEYENDKQLQEIGSTVQPKLAILKSVYAHTHGRAPDEVPTSPGACIKNGFISGPASDQVREDIAVNFVSRTMPDLKLHIVTDSGIGAEETTLMDRVPDLARAVKISHSHFLKKGDGTTQSGLRFQQVLVATPTPNELPANLWFDLEANSRHGNAQAPLLVVELKREVVRLDPEGKPHGIEETLATHPPSESALSEAASVALWNKVVSSLRKRPGAF